MTPQPPPEMALQRSSRDAATMADRLADWLADQDGAGPDSSGERPGVELIGSEGATGMSSETMLASVLSGAGQGEYVLRMAPADEDVPVFRSYRLDHQFDVLRRVAEQTDVPVPEVHWLEATGEVLGAPFFMMERIEGVVPPDVMPYTFGDNWVFDAGPDERRALQERTVATIAALHSIPAAASSFGFLDAPFPGATPLRRHAAKTRDWYGWAASAVGRSALVERALDWLEANWPDNETAAVSETMVLSWGDARIGNMLYRDFTPVGVLDWEMAGLGPRELDLGWLVFAHRVFQSLAESFELPGLPDFLRAEDVIATYQEHAGTDVGDLTWYQLYAAVIWSIVFMRTGARQAHFGEIELPDEPEALFHHGDLFRRLLDEVGA